MITVTTQELIQGVCNKRGMDPDSPELDTGLANQIAAALDERTRQAWEREMWPFACAHTKRQFAATWAVGTTYATDEAVLAGSAYYVSQGDANVGNNPIGDDGTYWLPMAAHQAANPDFVWHYLIAFDQAWAAAGFDEVNVVHDSDPLYHTNARELAYEVTADGIVLTGTTLPAAVYLHERGWAPRVAAGPAWTAVSYTEGASVYYATDGKTYVATDACSGSDVPGTSSNWAEQQIPRKLKPFIVHAAYADSLRADGQIERAMSEGRVAMAILNDIADRIFVGQQQTQRAIVE